MKLTEIKQKVQDLISQAVEENNRQKERLNFLFRKLDEAKELETLERLKEYENGKYLKAFLLYKSISRANYQVEHLKLTQLENTDKCLEMFEKDLEANQPKEKKSKEFQPLTDRQLLIMLGERIAKREIKSDANHDYLYVADEHFKKVITMIIETGKIKPNPVEEFFDKHNLKNNR